MIESLHIENLGVIAEATLDPGAGLTALTGETGAGKTMAITSLELILGGKADPSKVRAGASMARVEGVFTVARDSPLLPTIDGVGGAYDLEDDRAVVVVSRHIPAKGRKGRSAAFLGGRRVPTSVLRDIARHLVSLHGQSDQIRLATGSQQRRALDAFAGAPVARALEAWRSAYGAYGEAVAALEEFDETSRDQARQRLALQALVGKVDAVEPLPGEDDSLREEAHRLENVESRFLALSQAAAHLAGSDAVETAAIDGLAEAVRALEGLDDGRDAAELASRLRGLEAEVNDIAATLADMAGRAEADPERLSDVYARRQALAELRRDLGMGADEAIRAADEARATLERLGRRRRAHSAVGSRRSSPNSPYRGRGSTSQSSPLRPAPTGGTRSPSSSRPIKALPSSPWERPRREANSPGSCSPWRSAWPRAAAKSTPSCSTRWTRASAGGRPSPWGSVWRAWQPTVK